MIPSGTVKATMEELITEQGEHNISVDGPKTPYAKRSNVVGLWRKREEAIKASNEKSKEREQARQMQYEEKKEGNQEFEHDSRQQEKNFSDMFPSDPMAGVVSERNAPEPIADTSWYDPSEVYHKAPSPAPRRSNVRDSWKKKAASSPSAHLSQPDIMKSPSERSAPAHNRINESPSNANNNASAFDELKSKWKKFGVQNEGSPKPQTYKPETYRSRIAERKVEAKAEGNPKSTPDLESNQTANNLATSQTSRGIAVRRIGSNRFRSRVARKPTTSSTNSTDEIMGASAGGSGSEKKVSDTLSSNKASPKQPAPVIEKELVPNSPLDEMNNRDAPKTPVVTAYSRQENAKEVTPTSPISPTSPASSISRSSLSTRAHRRLRESRMTNQTRNEEEQEEEQEEDKNVKEADLSNITPMPMDESLAFKESLRSKSTQSTDDFMESQTSPLKTVVPDMETMVPDQFFSEKDANVDSIKSVIERTSLVQIANDMREEASTLFELDIINDGVQSALNTLGLADMFPSKAQRKGVKRPPSPVEEVAIEVEYVADMEG